MLTKRGTAFRRQGKVAEVRVQIDPVVDFCVCCISRTARAGVIVNDTWSDGTRSDPASPTYSENGTDSDSDGDLESAWYSSPGTAMVATVNHLTTTQQSGSSSYTSYFTPEASPVNLANVGDSMKLTWVFTPTVAAAQSNTSQNFRLAVVHTPTGSRLTADGTPGNALFTGYAMFMNMSTGTTTTPENLGNSSPFRLETRSAITSSDILGTSGNWTAAGTTGAASGTHGYDSGTQYTYTMTLTHNAAGGLDIVSKMTGGTLGGTGTAQVAFTDPTPNGSSFLFDTFSIRPSSAVSTADTFNTTNFKVEFTPASSGTTPEPASLGLICITGLGLVRRRHRA